MSNNDFTVDISTLLRILKKYAAVIIVFTAVAVFVAILMAEVVLEKKYAATAKFHIQNSRVQSEITNVGDINASRLLIKTCAELFTVRDVIERLEKAVEVPYSVEEIGRMISMGSANDTEFLNVTITSSDAETAVYMLRNYVDICMQEFERVIESGKITLVGSPFTTGNHVFPSIRLFAVIGFLAGFAISYLVVFVVEILDTKVKAEDDLFAIFQIPVFAEVMCFDSKVKGDYNSYE